MKKEKSVDGSILLAICSGLLGLLGFMSCCGFPALAAILASVGIGSGFVSAIKPYQPYLLGFAYTMLAVGFYKAYRPAKGESCCGSGTRTKKRVILWIIAIALTVSRCSMEQKAEPKFDYNFNNEQTK